MEIQEMDGALMSICAETQGCFEMEAESGEPMGTCVYSMLIQLWYTSQSLSSADEKGGGPTNYLFHFWPIRKRKRLGPSAKCIHNV